MAGVFKAAVQGDYRCWDANTSTLSLQLRSVAVSRAEHRLGETETLQPLQVTEEHASEQLECLAMN